MGNLISAADLLARLDDANDPLVLLDVRWVLTVGRPTQGPGSEPTGRPGYDEGHLPGAHFVDLDTELAGVPGAGGRHPLPDPDDLQQTLRRCGIGNTSAVVVYDQRDGFAAARAWWLLRWVGLQEVQVLDGGYEAWLRAAGPVSTIEPEPSPGTIDIRPGAMPAIDAEQAGRWSASGLLLDARAPERYAGKVEPIDPVAGHIPGAVNSPTTAWLTEDGTFRTDLAAHWQQIRDAAQVSSGDGSRDGAVAVYCGSGVTAAHHILALAELGVPAALYPGSWSEWITDPAREVAVGEV